MLRTRAFILAACLALALAAGCSDDDGGECGNEVIESGEDCDGAELGGETCESQGFEAGTLTCSAGCAFNYSACGDPLPCGNGAIDTGEECDGDAFGGATCVSVGFPGGGDLACATDCTFDTSACVMSEDCGNGAIDPGEECDGDALDGETCETRGFPGGALACAANCTFDTSGCDPVPQTGEDCAGAIVLNDTGVTDITGAYEANTNDVLSAAMVGCHDGYNGVVDSVFTFEMLAPNTDVTIQMPKEASYRYAAVLLESCPGSPPPLSCTRNDNDDLMILVAHGLTAGPYYLVVGNAWSDPFPDSTFHEIQIFQYRTASASLDAVGTGQWYSGATAQWSALGAGDLPMDVGFGASETVSDTDSSYREFVVTGASGILLEGTYAFGREWDFLRARDAGGIYYLNEFEHDTTVPQDVPFSVYVPGDTAIIGVDSAEGGGTLGSGYTITAVSYH